MGLAYRTYVPMEIGKNLDLGRLLAEAVHGHTLCEPVLTKKHISILRPAQKR